MNSFRAITRMAHRTRHMRTSWMCRISSITCSSSCTAAISTRPSPIFSAIPARIISMASATVPARSDSGSSCTMPSTPCSMRMKTAWDLIPPAIPRCFTATRNGFGRNFRPTPSSGCWSPTMSTGISLTTACSQPHVRASCFLPALHSSIAPWWANPRVGVTPNAALRLHGSTGRMQSTTCSIIFCPSVPRSCSANSATAGSIPRSSPPPSTSMGATCRRASTSRSAPLPAPSISPSTAPIRVCVAAAFRLPLVSIPVRLRLRKPPRSRPGC